MLAQGAWRIATRVPGHAPWKNLKFENHWNEISNILGLI